MAGDSSLFETASRCIELYAVVFRDFDVSNIDDWWIARFMKDRKYKIEHDVPFIDFDFASLAAIVTGDGFQ